MISPPLAKLKRYWEHARNHSGGKRFYTLYIFFDMLYCRLVFGAYQDAYAMYELHRFNRFQSGDFLTYKTQSRFWRQFNSEEAHRLFVNKFRFNQRFSVFIGRRYLLADASSTDAVRKFIETVGQVIVKPVDDHCGYGIFRLDGGDASAVENFIASLKERTYIVEELVRNAEALRRLNPHSLNTLRVVTCIDRVGQMHVISATLRMGRGTSCVDNAHSGGIACAVNLDEGIVDSYALDHAGNRFLVHPLTGVTIIGLRIPHWERMMSYLERLAAVEPTARYVGWDIAVTDDGFELIEGNTDHDSDVMQMCHLIGRRRQIRALL